MNQILVEKLQRLIEDEVRAQVNNYAQIISKRHDISLKLLLRDMDLLFTDGPQEGDKCKGITKKKTQCTNKGKHDGFCSLHVIQKRVPILIPHTPVEDVPVHVGHVLQEQLFLAGCPACDKLHQKPKLMIEF